MEVIENYGIVWLFRYLGTPDRLFKSWYFSDQAGIEGGYPPRGHCFSQELGPRFLVLYQRPVVYQAKFSQNYLIANAYVATETINAQVCFGKVAQCNPYTCDEMLKVVVASCRAKLPRTIDVFVSTSI